MRFAATNLNNFMDPMNFGAIGKANIMGQGLEERANIQGKAYLDRAEIKGDEIIGVAKAGLPAIAADASAASQASVMNGFTSGIQSLAGGIAEMPGIGGGGGASKYGFDPIGSQGNPLGGMGGRPLLNY